MTDPISMSKNARESLSRGLQALQADPSVPPDLVELAAPIAQAMGALHQIERTQALVPHADTALDHVRGALQKLQAVPSSHPAVTQALESVASSLSVVHALSKMATTPAQAPAPAPTPFAQSAPATTTAPLQGAHAAPPQAPPVAKPAQAPPAAHAYPPYQSAPAQPVVPAPAAPAIARDPFAAPPPKAAPPPAPPPPQAPQAAPPTAKPASPSIPVPAPPPNDLPIVPADLGAHSPTNFYKGLAGNDIIDHGGLFVSTYVPPKIGAAIRLRVSLPGGYEFEANAVVRWTREQGGDSPPGFGAQFTAITPEAKQLVYRYVRNREPLFYDDF